ncbi:MAG: leishmanolysin-related zinc metalloendopeptidase, partial [Cyanobacteria bacterium J06639_1]
MVSSDSAKTSDRVSGIFRDDPSAVALEDAAIALAIANLPASSLDAISVADAANRLLDATREVTAVSLNPDLLAPECVDYVEANSGAQPNDVAAILAGANLGDRVNQADTLASVTNVILIPSDTLSASDITFVPGQTQPCLAPPSEFDIRLRFFDTSLSPSQQAVVRDAANRWMRAILSDSPSESVRIEPNECLDGTPLFDETVDDLAIDVYAVPIDRANGTLAQAGPCVLRPGSNLPVYGVLQFDTNDLDQLERDGELFDIALHEMAHVLGFGTIWTDLGLLSQNSGGIGLNDPRFLGTNAQQAYADLGESGTVPVENLGGAGSINSHWRESTFGSELMTSRVTTGANPLSRLTIAQFADLGYRVNPAVADAYSLPFSSRFGGATSLQSPEVVRTERLIYP